MSKSPDATGVSRERLEPPQGTSRRARNAIGLTHHLPLQWQALDLLMNNKVVPVELRNVHPMDNGYAVFLGNEQKTFVIFVDEPVGVAITMSMRGIVKDRPLTHDLMGHLLRAFGATVERVVINALDGGVFYARLIISAQNELQQRKVVEIDARPSDSIALAVSQSAPIFVAADVLESVDDVSDTLDQLQKQGRRKREE